ncbi:hypothetical protein HPP92_016755 [Vanilla planifolia]|uniref:Glutathione S-transferase n=1 Tax=Vanilla planifolia TaxID=51239 RepID=A0A835QGB5_VANPL|nr:hypothetical protein HPP92_016755 [Vanilla planifolia]
MAEKGVKLFGMWASPFSLRAEWALRLKGIEYEFVNEDLDNKSAELLRLNPVTKKIPVLAHDGRPLAESLIIIEYIDEAWTHGKPIMPKDPYHRAQARFWAKFAEDKENWREEFLRGEEIGYLDLAVGWLALWVPMMEELAGVTVVNRESHPLLLEWFEKFLSEEVVKGRLPAKDRLYALNRDRREQIISGRLAYGK